VAAAGLNPRFLQVYSRRTQMFQYLIATYEDYLTSLDRKVKDAIDFQ
jgi:hypothetical protein